MKINDLLLRLTKEKYLNRWIIFLIDLFLSVFYTFRQLYKLWRIDYVFYSEFLKGQDCFSPDAPYSDHNMVVWRGILLK